MHPTAPSNIVQPSGYLVYRLAEVASDYLSLDFENSKIKSAFKVASYVIIFFPIAAYLVHHHYISVENECTSFLRTQAAESLNGALWVSKNIQNYRLYKDYKKHEIVIAYSETIAKNYAAFLAQIGQSNHAECFFNFQMTDGYYARAFLHKIAEIAERNIGGLFSSVLDHTWDYVLTPEERINLFQGLAYHGIVPKKEVINSVEEGYTIVKTLARGTGSNFGTGIIFECIDKYALNQDQRFEVAKILTKHEFESAKYIVPCSMRFENLAKFNLTAEQHLELQKMIVHQFNNHLSCFLRDNR